MKFLHLADCHLDAPFVELGQLLNKSNARRYELKETFDKAIELAKQEKVDAIFIAGDLFEQKYVTKSTINFLNSKFMEIPNIQVFISPGNHDPFINNSYYNMLKWPENVKIFKGELEMVAMHDLNVNIWGTGFEEFYIEKCLVRDIDEEYKKDINILLTHGTLDLQGTNENYHPIPNHLILSMKYDYYALGHIHKPLFYENDRICYSGSLEPLGFDELGEHGVILGEITKDYRKIKFCPISKRKYYIKEIDITGALIIEDVIDKIRQEIEYENSKDNFYKILLTGKPHEDFLLDIDTIIEVIKEQFFYICIEDHIESSYHIEEIKNEETLKGIFTRKMLEMIEKAEDNEKMKLKSALRFGLDALIKGEIEIK